MSKRNWCTCVLIAMSLLAAVGFGGNQSGAEVFAARCASCHGADGAGNTNAAKTLNGMPDLRTAIKGMTDKQVYETIARGTDHKKYPHVYLQAGVTPDQINEIVAHLRKLQKK